MWLSATRSWGAVELGPEFFLRHLRRVDPDDDDELVQFVNDFGIPWIDPTTRQGVPHYLFPKVVLAEIRQQRRQRCSVESARWMVRSLRALVAHWVAATEASDVSAIPRAWTAEGFGVRSEAAAWQLWIAVVNAVLEPFAPRVVLLEEGDEDGFGEFGLQEIGLESAVAAQMYDAINRQLPLKRCGCVGCDQFFFQQDPGKPRNKQRLTGVVYCSKKCANRQTNRNRRARLRAGLTAQGENPAQT